MEGFVVIQHAQGVMSVRPAAVSAVAPVPNAIAQSQVIIDGVPVLVPLTPDEFLSQLSGKPPSKVRIEGRVLG